MQILNNKITGETLTANEWNELPTEMQNIFEAYGIVPSNLDLKQINEALSNKATAGNWYNRSGGPNNYVLSSLTVHEDPTEYREGMLVRFYITAGNQNGSGASTVNVAGLGNKTIVKSLTNSSDIPEGYLAGYTELEYNGTNFIALNKLRQNEASNITEPSFYKGLPFSSIARNNWVGLHPTGNTFTFGAGATTANQCASLTSELVVIFNGGTQNLESYSWDGTDWAKVGNSLNLASITSVSIRPLTPTTIALYGRGDNELQVYEWDGTDWSQVGNGLDIGQTGTAPIAVLNSTTIAAGIVGGLETYEWDGTDWSQVGNTLLITPTAGSALTEMTATSIAYVRGSVLDLQVYEWDGTDWSQVGTALDISPTASFNLASVNSTDIVKYNFTLNTWNIYRFNTASEEWSAMGPEIPFTASTFDASITAINGRDICLVSYIAPNLTIKTVRLDFYTGQGNYVNSLL